MKLKFGMALFLSLVGVSAWADFPEIQQTEVQCYARVTAIIEGHKSLMDAANPNRVADDEWVTKLKEIQTTLGSCEAVKKFIRDPSLSK
jgi:hypothetical protein